MTSIGNCKEFVNTGKPSRNIIDLIVKENDIKDRSKVIMVGDRPDTDMELGRNSEIDCCLVMTGVVRSPEDFKENWSHKYQATYLMQSFGKLE